MCVFLCVIAAKVCNVQGRPLCEKVYSRRYMGEHVLLPVPTYQPARVGAINLSHYKSVWSPRCGQCGHFCEVHKLNPRKMLWAMCRGFSQKKIPVIFYSANFWMSSEFWVMKPVSKERKKQFKAVACFFEFRIWNVSVSWKLECKRSRGVMG